MSDTLSRVKLQLRPVNGSVLNGNGNGSLNGDDKTPTSPATKLLLNHGKPNYTIQRSPKSPQNGAANPSSNDLQNSNRNNYYPYKSAGVKGTTGIFTNGYNNSNNQTKITTNNNNYNSCGSSNSSQNGDELIIQSTKFNGAFKPTNLQSIESRDDVDNHVVLRRVQKSEKPTITENGNDENVPEFILRQRRIQERLSKENVLDFENRRSGYFTHVLISPTSPNRTSLVETMSSPPIVPSLEIPPPQQQQQQAQIQIQAASTTKEASITEESSAEVSEALSNGGEEQKQEENVITEIVNEHNEGGVEDNEKQKEKDEDEVAKAIEEVNKAVAGEPDDEKIEEEKVLEVVNEKKSEEVEVVVVEETENSSIEQKENEEPKHEEEEQHVVAVVNIEETQIEQPIIPIVSVVVTSAPLDEVEVVETPDNHTVVVEPTIEITNQLVEEPEHKESSVEVVVITSAHNEVAAETAVDEPPKENGHAAEIEESAKTNGHAVEEVTISHTNGLANGVSCDLITPCLPKPDPSGALGVNYEPKTVVSFSKDLGAPNKYPDTVKIVKTEVDGTGDPEMSGSSSDELKEMAKLKFDIKTDDMDVQVTPVLRTD